MHSLLLFPDDKSTSPNVSTFCFVAVQASWIQAEDLQTLTPRFMHWDSEIWLLDLTPCLSYWSLQAQTQGVSLADALHTLLSRLAADRPYYAALAPQPWQALLLTLMLEAKNFSGLTAASQRVGRNLLSALSWEVWWRCAERYASHTPAPTNRTFAKQRRAMQLALRRLSCDTPTRLKGMPSAQIRRRFGPLIGLLWEQTFPASSSSWSAEDTVAFPWQSHHLALPLTQTRHLDFPVNDWSLIEEFLREDLNRLCLLESFKKGERILNLEWRIVLFNLQEIPISILFRHPHCLQHESPHQRTALLQISYAFQQHMRTFCAHNVEAPWIVSWELHILQKIRPIPQQKGLFADTTESWDDLLTLENQLDRPLEVYQVCEDWLPEDSYIAAEAATRALGEEQQMSLQHLGRHRPLFLMQRPEPLNTYGQSLLWKFRERTMGKWWLPRRDNTVRDYYQVVAEEQVLWVFRDAQGQCFLHGVYG